MDDYIKSAIAAIENAIATCAQSNTGGVPAYGRFLKSKKLLMETISKDVAELKRRAGQGEEQNSISRICELAAREVIHCGDLYFNQLRNDTTVLDREFMSEAENILKGITKSGEMESILRSAYESWHWHGH